MSCFLIVLFEANYDLLPFYVGRKKSCQRETHSRSIESWSIAHGQSPRLLGTFGERSKHAQRTETWLQFVDAYEAWQRPLMALTLALWRPGSRSSLTSLAS